MSEFDEWWESANTRLTDLPKEQARYIWDAARATTNFSPVSMPEKMERYPGYAPAEDGEAGEYYVEGWNNCRDEMLEKMQWGPIETAPKDGGWILMSGGDIEYGWEFDEPKPPMVVAQWSENMYCWQFAWYDGGYYGEYVSPTGWMPLPDTDQDAYPFINQEE